MKLILIRHGETQENVMGILQGHAHGKLSVVGIEQTKKLALRLKNKKIDFIISSDLGRAVDTVAEIKKYHHIPVLYSREIRERGQGIFEGKKIDKYLTDCKASGKSRIEYKALGGESYLEMRERAKKFLKYILRMYKEKTILVCSHGGFNLVLLSLIMGKTLEDILENLKQNNTCVNTIKFLNGQKPVLHKINCTRHLRTRE